MRTYLNIRPATNGSLGALRPMNLSEFRQIEESFNRLFGSSTANPSEVLEVNNEVHRHPIVLDISESSAAYVLTASIPGIDPGAVEIQIDNGVLSIRAERQPRPLAEGETPVRRELRAGAFGRTVSLPANVDAPGTTAEFSNGLVTITIPRIAEVKPEPLRIPVRTSQTENSLISNLSQGSEASEEPNA